MSLFIQIRLLMLILLLITVHLNTKIWDKKLHDSVFSFIVIAYLVQISLIIPVYFVSLDDYGYIYYAAPFSLFYGPALYFYYRAALYNKLEIRTIIVHSVPVLLLWAVYFFFIWDTEIRQITVQWYYPIKYGAIGVSLFGYSLFILIKEKRKAELMERIKYFSRYYILSSFFVVFLTVVNIFKKGSHGEHVSENISMAIFMTIGAVIMLTEAIRRFKEQYFPKEKPILLSGVTKKINEKKIPTNPVSSWKIKLLENFFVSDYICDPLMDLENAADIMGLDQADLKQCIQEYYVSTFQKILTTKRIQLVCELLKDEEFDRKYDLLASNCGFKSQATFYRNFKQLKGCSPSKYRDSLE